MILSTPAIRKEDLIRDPRDDFHDPSLEKHIHLHGEPQDTCNAWGDHVNWPFLDGGNQMEWIMGYMGTYDI